MLVEGAAWSAGVRVVCALWGGRRVLQRVVCMNLGAATGTAVRMRCAL